MAGTIIIKHQDKVIEIPINILGTIADRVIAEKYNIAGGYFLARLRYKLGIKAYRKHSTAHCHNQKVDVEAIIPKLGKFKDIRLAEEYGISRERVRQLRLEYGIPKFKIRT